MSDSRSIRLVPSIGHSTGPAKNLLRQPQRRDNLIVFRAAS